MNDRYSPAVILKSRVRLARNIIDYPFPPVLNEVCRKEIIEKAATVLLAQSYTQIDELFTVEKALALSEDHLISREFANEKEPHALFLSPDRNISVMVCEEDHLRIQAFSDGLALAEAKNNAVAAERLLNAQIRFAFDEKTGYRTHCPTNLGTAMRASVMMFLPALTLTNRMRDLQLQLEKIGITVRGLYGEGSAADACIYQLSNSLSLGLSEDDLVQKVEAVALRIAEDEVAAQSNLFTANPDMLTDKVFRALGILQYAHMLSGKEFFECYTYVRFGIALGMIENIGYPALDALLSQAMPAHICLQNSGAAKNTALRDRLRAQTVRNSIGGRN